MTWLLIASAFVFGVLAVTAAALVWALAAHENVKPWGPPEIPDWQIDQGTRREKK